MPIQVTMPRLSDTMEQGTVVKWNVKEGQQVKSGDVVADIETDKATMELQSFDDGTVAKLAVPEGQSVKVGTVIMTLAAPGESVEEAKKGGGAASAPAKASAPAAKKEVGETRRATEHGVGFSERENVGTAVMEPPRQRGPTQPPPSAASPAPEPKDRVFVSPLARKIAEEAGVDLNGIEGTGPSGRITRKDVEAAISSGPVAKAPEQARPRQARVPTAGTVSVPAFESDLGRLEGRVVPLSNMRRVIARRLVESTTTIP